jgi:glyoxylate reductase
MTQPSVFITRRIPEIGIELLKPVADLDIWEGELPPPYETLLERARGKDGLLSLLTDRIDISLLQACAPRLKVVSQFAVGVDNIDVAAATRLGIPVGNTPGVLTDATADFAWALLMAAARRVVEADRLVHQGLWKTWGPRVLLGPAVAGAVLGIIGFGRIGQAVAKRARGFEMRILYHDPQRQPQLEATLGVEYASLDVLLSTADFISIHTPLTAETHHLMGAAQFARMKPGAVLINTARGPVVDPAALYQALVTHQIGAAALDVTEPEPLPMNSPLLTLDNLIVAPHIASASIPTRNRMAEMAALNLIAGLKGEPLPNCVNPLV